MEKYDLNGVRTPQDVIRRFDLKNIKVLMDDVEGITTEVSKKVGNDEIISKINQSAEEVSIKANKISLEGVITNNKGFAIDEQGNMECNHAQMKNADIVGGSLHIDSPEDNPEITITNYGSEDRGTLELMLSGAGFYLYDKDGIVVDEYGMYSLAPYAQLYTLGSHDYEGVWAIFQLGSELGTTITLDGQTGEIDGFSAIFDGNDIGIGVTTIEGGEITCVSVTQTSKEESKKNFEKLENALDIVKNTDIYKYNLKTEKDTDKKHIGFVIGDKFKYREEITSKRNDGVDTYSMISVLWKAVQEQQKEIEELKKKVNK